MQRFAYNTNVFSALNIARIFVFPHMSVQVGYGRSSASPNYQFSSSVRLRISKRISLCKNESGSGSDTAKHEGSVLTQDISSFLSCKIVPRQNIQLPLLIIAWWQNSTMMALSASIFGWKGRVGEHEGLTRKRGNVSGTNGLGFGDFRLCIVT